MWSRGPPLRQLVSRFVVVVCLSVISALVHATGCAAAPLGAFPEHARVLRDDGSYTTIGDASPSAMLGIELLGDGNQDALLDIEYESR